MATTFAVKSSMFAAMILLLSIDSFDLITADLMPMVSATRKSLSPPGYKSAGLTKLLFSSLVLLGANILPDTLLSNYEGKKQKFPLVHGSIHDLQYSLSLESVSVATDEVFIPRSQCRFRPISVEDLSHWLYILIGLCEVI